jgi:competence protein ComEC
MVPSLRLAALALALVVFAAACATPERKRKARAGRDVDDAGDVDDAPAPVVAIDDARALRVHMLDIGQGAATLLETPCGAILVDTGGEQNASFDGVAALSRQLDAFFARRTDLNNTIDLLVITHPHVDHVRGIPLVLSRYTVKGVVDGGHDGGDEVREQMQTLQRVVAEKNVPYRRVKNSTITKKNGITDAVIDPLRCAAVDPVVRVLEAGFDEDPGWGTDNYGHRHFDDMNNHSVVLRVDVGNASVLITGDLEEVAIRELVRRYRDTRWLDVDVWLVGHHGSMNGTTRDLLLATSPQVALISCGPPSRELEWTAFTFGHPRGPVVDLLQEFVELPRSPLPAQVARGMKRFESRIIEKAIYATAWDGAVTVALDASGAIRVDLAAGDTSVASAR